jgi:hypothetical protein
VIDTIRAILAAFAIFFRSRLDISLEVLALRQQVAVLKRKHRPELNRLDRLFWIMLRNVWPRWLQQLPVYLRRSPARILNPHLANQNANLLVDPRSTDPPPRSPTPI